jgi:hypothetical protein
VSLVLWRGGTSRFNTVLCLTFQAATATATWGGCFAGGWAEGKGRWFGYLLFFLSHTVGLKVLRG